MPVVHGGELDSTSTDCLVEGEVGPDALGVDEASRQQRFDALVRCVVARSPWDVHDADGAGAVVVRDEVIVDGVEKVTVLRLW